MVTTLAAQLPLTPAGKPANVAPVAPVVLYVILVIAVLIQTVCASVPAAEVNVIVLGVAGMVEVHKPRPWVAAAMVRSLGRYLIMSVRTVGKVPLAVHTVLPPLSRVVSQTPVSVAI